MTLRTYLSNILDSIKTAIQSIHIEMFDESYSGTNISFTSKVADIPFYNFAVNVQGIQEGSGIPAPDNKRNIISYGQCILNSNGIYKNYNLGRNFYEGILYPNLGIFIANRGSYTTTDTTEFSVAATNYIKYDACDCYFTIDSNILTPSNAPATQPLDLKCDSFKFERSSIWSSGGFPNCWTVNSNQIHFNIANNLIGVVDYTQETLASARTKLNNYLHDNPVTFTYPCQRVFYLTPDEVKTIIGTNTISANTGSISFEIPRPKLKSNI